MTTTFCITDLPGVCRRRGWPVAALLMERWFRGGGRVLTAAQRRDLDDPRQMPSSAVCLETIRMDWALQFSRVRAQYDQLLAHETYTTGRGLKQLEQRVRRAASLVAGASTFQLGDLTRP